MWIIRNLKDHDMFWVSGAGYIDKKLLAPTQFPDHVKQKVPLPVDGEWVLDVLPIAEVPAA